MSHTKTDEDLRSSTDLVTQYRPLGLKAVLAAALQVKKPVKKPALPAQAFPKQSA